MIYVDGYYPKPLYDAIIETYGEKTTAKASLWLSRPRLNSYNGAEVITYEFQKAASLSAIEMKVLQASTHVEVFYTNRDGEKLPLLQTNRQAIKFDTAFSEANRTLLPALSDNRKLLNDLTWSTHSYECYPVIVTSVEIRLTRNKTGLAPKTTYPLGLKDVLLKRSITTRQDAASPIPDSVDSVGNQVSHTISDWTPEKAIDDSTETFWKSEPQPSPDAVTSLYVDVTDENNEAQWIDHFFLDPVSAGQQMNVYYSNDDTVGPSLPSEAALKPTMNNVTYNDGLVFTNTDSKVEFDKSLLDSKKSQWYGFQWRPTQAGLATLWSWGNMSIQVDDGLIRLITTQSQLELQIPDFALNKTYNIVAAINLSDSSYQGRYIGVVESGKTNVTENNALGVALIGENSPRSFTVNNETKPLNEYFSILDNRLTPISGAFELGDRAVLTLTNPNSGHSGTNKRVSFETVSGSHWGGMIDGEPEPSTVVAKNTTGTPLVSLTVPHTSTQLVPNTLLEKGFASLGPIAGPAPVGNAVQLDTTGRFFEMQDYISVTRNERLLCSFLAKTVYGQGVPVPMLSGGLSSVSTPSITENLADGWRRYSCTITPKITMDNLKLGFRVSAFDDDAQMLLAAPSVVRDKALSNWTHDDTSTGSLKSIELTYNHGPGSVTISIPTAVTLPQLPAFVEHGKPTMGPAKGVITGFVAKQTPGTPDSMQQYLLSPDTYVLPDPAPDLENRYSTLASAVIVGRLSFENIFRGGVDGTKFTSKVWTPVFEDWTVSRRWFYFPNAIKMKYLKLEFTNLVMEPYPVWEDGVEASYRVFPVSVTETSKHLATLDTRKETVTTTVNTSTDIDTTRNGKLTSTKALHDRAVTQTSSSSTSLSEVDLPREYVVEVGNPITTSFPASSGIELETEFHQETANSAIFKGGYVQERTDVDVSTTSRQVARKVKKTWTENVVKKTTKMVAQDIYYTVRPGDYLLKIAQKLGIPDWRVIYAYNIWLQSDYRVAMLPARPVGWWIFPGQVFRIPGAVMKQVTTYTTVKVTRSSTETVYDTVVDTTTVTTNTRKNVDISIDREETLSTTRNRFRDTSVHRYDIKTVTRNDKYAYFVAIRDLLIAKTNWLVERDTPVFDFADYEADSWQLTGVLQEGSIYRPSGEFPTGQLISPQYSTVSPFRTIKILGSQRGSLSRKSAIQGLSQPPTYRWDNKQYAPLSVSKSGTSWTLTGGQASSNAAIVFGPFSVKAGETVSGQMTIKPLTVSALAKIELRIVDLDTEETLAVWKEQEDSLTPDTINEVQWPSWFANRDVENLGLVYAVMNKGILNWTVSNPMYSVGTMRILARNNSSKPFEDVSQALDSAKNQYTFADRGNSLEIRIEMSDQSDWTSRLQVIPLYLTDDLRA